jgi:hypothetical protein
VPPGGPRATAGQLRLKPFRPLSRRATSRSRARSGSAIRGSVGPSRWGTS